VGALNPDGTVALFSNDGSWVRFWRPGACLVSTLPTTFDGSEQARSILTGQRGEVRAALDPDDFTAGFAVWSGTSFAAPFLAGQLAAEMLRRRRDDEVPGESAVQRARAALAALPAIGGR
jgi:subtilisin family serine protease